MSASQSQDSPPPVNRRRQAHTSRACNYCSKTRCDGKHPSCSTCESHSITCFYSTEKDARKSASKAYVESLKSRIQSLEITLSKFGVPLTETDADQGPSGMSENMDTPSSPVSYPSPTEEPGSKSPGPLVIKESGDLHMYGPTSAYSHLPGRPALSAATSSAPSEDNSSAHDSDSSARISSWNCNLPAGVPITQEQHDLLLNRFFTFYSSWCLRADKTQFTKGMKNALQQSSHSTKPRRHLLRKSSRHQGSSRYSPMLHNAILALACTYADLTPSDSHLASQETRDLFGRTAKSMIDQECSRPTLATVEALALLSSYHASKMEDGLFSLHLGMAVRMGEALGLNVDCSAWVRTGHITQQDMVDRVNVFWSIFIQDKLYALFVGRGSSIPTSLVTTPLPAVDKAVDDELWHYEGDSDIITNQPSYLSTTFVETCKASLILTRILDVNYSIKSNANQLNRNIQVSDIRVQLDAWYDQLPSKLRVLPSSPFNAMPHVLMLHLSYWWFSILLHRPFYPHPDAHQIAVKRCDAAADKIVLFFEIWRKLHGLRFTPVTAIQAAFAAGTTYLLAAVNSNPSTKRNQDAIKGAKSCIQSLREMGTTYPAGNQNAEILQNLLKEWTENHLRDFKMKTDGGSSGDSKSALKLSNSPEPPASANSPDSQRSGSSRNVTTPTQKTAVLGVQQTHPFHAPGSGGNATTSPTLMGPGGPGGIGGGMNHHQHHHTSHHSSHHHTNSGSSTTSNHSATSPSRDQRWSSSTSPSTSAPNSSMQGQTTTGNTAGAGAPYSPTSHPHSSYIQGWDVSGFQRVLSDMDAAPFSYSTFGIESASNPFPPLPHPYSFSGGGYVDSPMAGYGHGGNGGGGSGYMQGGGQVGMQGYGGYGHGAAGGGGGEYAGYGNGVPMSGQEGTQQHGGGGGGGMVWGAAGAAGGGGGSAQRVWDPHTRW